MRTRLWIPPVLGALLLLALPATGHGQSAEFLAVAEEAYTRIVGPDWTKLSEGISPISSEMGSIFGPDDFGPGSYFLWVMVEDCTFNCSVELNVTVSGRERRHFPTMELVNDYGFGLFRWTQEGWDRIEIFYKLLDVDGAERRRTSYGALFRVG